MVPSFHSGTAGLKKLIFSTGNDPICNKSLAPFLNVSNIGVSIPHVLVVPEVILFNVTALKEVLPAADKFPEIVVFPVITPPVLSYLRSRSKLLANEYQGDHIVPLYFLIK